MVKCQICGLFEGDRKCLNCGRAVCSAETCVVAYFLGTNDDRTICINCA